MTDDRKRFTGFDALSEIGKRLEDLSKVVQSKLSSSGEPQTFTIETARGPITGVFGVEIRNLHDPDGSATRTPRRPTAQPASTAPTGPLTEVFDEGDSIVVVLDVPVPEGSILEARVAGDRATIVEAASGRDIATVKLPRVINDPKATVTLTNGILEVRISGS